MRLLLTALGSYGDVFPFVGLGAAMRLRGHEVAIITNPHFRSVVEGANLELIPLGTEQEYDSLTRHPDLWHPFRGPALVLKTGMVAHLRELYELIAAHYVAGQTVLGAHLLDVASRCFQEKHGAPLATIALQPFVFRSQSEPPRVIGMFQPAWGPRWLMAIQYWMGDRFFVDRLVAPELNALRAELGLAAVRRPMKSWCFSPQRVLGLFPDWFSQPQPDWPQAISLTGFPLWDQAASKQLSDKAKRFLDEGESPIVFAPGSAMTSGESFFQAAVEACQQLGRRGLLMSKYPDQLPKSLPRGVCHLEFEPFSQLLSQAAALVHHGGIGTSAQGLAAGVPQLVMPMAYDQADNATRLQRLGVASMLKPRRFRGPVVASKLGRLLGSVPVEENCRRWAEQCDGAAALAGACQSLEKLAAVGS